MNRLLLLAVGSLAVVGCDKLKPKPAPAAPPAAAAPPPAAAARPTLAEARKGFASKLVSRGGTKDPVPDPPPKVFRKVSYESPAGKLAAYVSPDPKSGKKGPAIIWITGGDCNSIDAVWEPAPASNDQTAHQFRDAGVVMMFPSLRGGNTNPGKKEGFLGEVADVLAAREFLAGQAYVDPARIYLGGHSTGGTLALLVAEVAGADKFRAVFSFGPVDDVSGYGPKSEFLPFDASDPREVELRSPGNWLGSIKTPVFVFEGARQGNLESLQIMGKANTNPNAHFLPVRGATHFSLLAPVNKLLAAKVVADTGPACNISVTEAEVDKAVGR